jgi:prephenate dehydrogenase
MRLFNRVAIVGTGLIGGSLALAIKKKRLANEIIGVSRHKNTLLLAKKKHIIDRGSQDIRIIRDADLVILATPVNTILKLAPKIRKHISRECIVSDVGSTKHEIVSKLEKIFPKFVGSHPLAGSEKRGVMNARPFIFEGSLCILTPTKNTNKEALAKLKKLWSQLGAKVVFLAPKVHDKALSFVSHLPHVSAFSLISAVPKKYLRFASLGLKDTTRIAASDSQLWCDILLSNQKNMLKAIEMYEDNLSQVKSAIKKKDKKLLDLILKKAKDKRISLNRFPA